MPYHLEQESIRLTQLAQDYHPVLRRRAYTSIRTSFPTFFQSEPQANTLSVNESQRIITQNFSKINQIIDMVDEHIRRRIECYQNEVVNVVQNQIQQMREETCKVVDQFNLMIQEKNKQNQIWSLNNELDYFKSEAKKLFDHNKKLKKENAQLVKKFKDYEWELENRQVIMQKLWQKYQKEKHHKSKLKTMMEQELQNIQSQASPSKKMPQPQIMQFSLKEDIFNIDEMPELKLTSNKSTHPIKEIRQPSPIEEHISQSDRAIPDNDNSVLAINYQDESEISKIEYKGKSKHFEIAKPQMKDQQSQVNIYLSEHSYKGLFNKKITSKKLTRHTQQIAIQTQQAQKSMTTVHRQNETNLSNPKRSKQINFKKNGFYMNEFSMPKSTHYRSSSSNFNMSKRDSFYNMKEKKVRLATQSNFNRQGYEEIGIELITQKYENENKRVYCKMAKRLEKNKIVERAYEKLKRTKQ